ncbi:uncharacterized protein EI97DRAFT_441388 [Westerdykella ornata]|uniref:Uncharacterized protein n=1 Tax=Westerdykella ornata TaxID=318751 RepID=A0A6A6JLD9_WESOR|nr:uncharacterized protein EI97DRAFT_441388 [Westerdykella ornata]KAF2277322.1 hypothetical protein EI97DRAFT_441388 [Westerdykella ornata]
MSNEIKSHSIAQVAKHIKKASARAYEILASYSLELAKEVDLGPLYHGQSIRFGESVEGKSLTTTWISITSSNNIELVDGSTHGRWNLSRKELHKMKLFFPFVDLRRRLSRSLWLSSSLSLAAYVFMEEGISSRFVEMDLMSLNALREAYEAISRIPMRPTQAERVNFKLAEEAANSAVEEDRHSTDDDDDDDDMDLDREITRLLSEEGTSEAEVEDGHQEEDEGNSLNDDEGDSDDDLSEIEIRERYEACKFMLNRTFTALKERDPEAALDLVQFSQDAFERNVFEDP